VCNTQINRLSMPVLEGVLETEPDAAATDAGTEPDVIHRAPPPPQGGTTPFGG
jgi:hypothetical protein